MRIIDAHVHTLANYAPMAPFEDMGRVDRLLHHMDEAGVEKALMLPVVQDFSPDNNAECGRWAQEHPDRLAAMTDVPLDAPDAAERVMAARAQYGSVAISCYPRTPDLAWMTASEHDAIWIAFQASGLVCNLQVTPPNYRHIIELAQRYRQVRFVLNHFGLPKGAGIAPEDVASGGLDEARLLDNLFVKVSAYYSVADTPWDHRCPTALAYLYRLRDLLGAERLMFGSDWPPAGRQLTYRQIVEIVRTEATELTEAEKAAILGETAARVYGI
ncbi:MAG: amidohydrolase [Gemmatimonadetes bacterium]|nr:amidohydrolase [Gemmatimonadota bacterium]